jgi:transcriptional regulator of met regulon
MFIAKPNDRNFMNSQQFETMQECKRFLDVYTEQKMPLDEWLMLGKIMEVSADGTAVRIEVDEESFL